MCGIAGCVGHENAPEFVVDSLEVMEYRGYDSAGVAIPTEEKLEIAKTLGGVVSLKTSIAPASEKSDVAMGHTRWATHGARSIANAHPHTNNDETIAVVCNGIIENHKELRTELTEAGYVFTSQTDTEVIPHLFDMLLQESDTVDEAFRRTLGRLTTSPNGNLTTSNFAVLALTEYTPDSLYAASVGGTLWLGESDNEYFAASDSACLADYKPKSDRLPDYGMAVLRRSGLCITDFRTGEQLDFSPQDIEEVQERATKGDFPHFMLKEIFDSPETIRTATRGRVRPEDNLVKLGGLEDVRERLREVNRIIITGCGTSFFAGQIGERLLEEIAGIPVEAERASIFKDRDNQPFDKNTAVIAISQSGATADTIKAIEKAQEAGLLALGVVNTPASRISQMTDAGVYCHAGQEVSVASTKAFTSQVTVLTEIALWLAKQNNHLNRDIMKELLELPEKVEEMLANTTDIQKAAKKYANYGNFLYIARGYDYPAAEEGALKLKETSYIHAEGIEAGEMKHGPLAMIDEDFPTVAIATDGRLLEKTLSNIEEIRARGGPVLAVATKGNESIRDDVDDVIYVPASPEQTQPILSAIALQLFAYYVANEKGLDIDRPRNLAKSVTVE